MDPNPLPRTNKPPSGALAFGLVAVGVLMVLGAVIYLAASSGGRDSLAPGGPARIGVRLGSFSLTDLNGKTEATTTVSRRVSSAWVASKRSRSSSSLMEESFSMNVSVPGM